MSTGLVKYDAACRALVDARSVDEADAVEIRLRATRQLDQLRVAQKETVRLTLARVDSSLVG